MSNNNIAILTEHIDAINKSLLKLFPTYIDDSFCLKQTGLKGNYDLISLNKAVEPLKYLMSLGGKRWRSLALTLSAEIWGIPKKDSSTFATLVEFPHTGSLIIDDIEDKAILRRSKTTAHLVYGVDISINAANYAYFIATTVIEECDQETNLKLEIFKKWTQALRSLHLGQALDIAWHQKDGIWPTTKEYLTMCQLKTGSLSQLAGNIAAILAGLDNKKQSKFTEAWQMIGVGFQILDDVKNLCRGVKGKIFADDLIEGKKSLPLILAVEKDEKLKSKFLDYFEKIQKFEGEKKQEMIHLIIKILNDMCVIDQAKEKGISIINSSRKFLKKNFPIHNTVEVLDSFLENLTKTT